MKHPQLEPIYTVEEAAKRMKLGRDTTYALVQLRKLTASKCGRQIRITESNIQDYLRSARI